MQADDRVTSWRQWGVIALIAAVGVATFLYKPVHLDDPNYLGVTARILEAPLDPYAGSSTWMEGIRFDVNANPPFWSYLYAAIAVAVGWNETAFHGLQAIAFCLFVHGLYLLARRNSNWPGYWTAAIALGPFVLPGVNLMLDLPMFALWVWALEFSLRGWSGKLRWSWLAGLLAAVAVVTKYTSVLLLLLFVFGAWRSGKWKTAVAVIPPVFTLLAWCVQNYLFYGRVHLVAHGGDVHWTELPERLLVLVRCAGSVCWMTPLWLAAFASRSPWFKLGSIPLVVLAIVLGWWDAGQATARLTSSDILVDPIARGHYLLFTANGLIAVVTGGWLAWSKTQNQPDALPRETLLVWLVLMTAFVLFAVPKDSFGAIRHFAPMLIPLLLLCARPVEAIAEELRSGFILTYGCWGVTVALGLGLAHADLEQARTYKTAAEKLVAPFAARREVWILGDASFRYYAQGYGAQFWNCADPDVSRNIRPGSLLIISYLQGMGSADRSLLDKCYRLDDRSFASQNPLRTITQTANYYGGNIVSLPWQIGHSYVQPKLHPAYLTPMPLEDFLIYQMP